MTGTTDLRRARRGSLFLEGAIAMAVIAVVFGILAWRQSQTTRDARDAAAAAGLRTVQQAVSTVIARNFDQILTQITARCSAQAPTCPDNSAIRFSLLAPVPGVGVALDALGMLPPGFADRNVHGQRYEIWLKKTFNTQNVTQLEGLVLTTDGTVLSDSRATEIATRADPSDGGIINGSNTVTGAYGAWAIDLHSYNTGAPIPLPGPGHVAALLRFDDSRAYADYIHRYATGNGTEPQTMHTSLDMGDKAIFNASDVTVRFSLMLIPDTVNPITVDDPCSVDREGRIASALQGEPVICVAETGGRFWRRVALLPACTKVGQFLSVDPTSHKLTCSPP